VNAPCFDLSNRWTDPVVSAALDNVIGNGDHMLEAACGLPQAGRRRDAGLRPAPAT